MKFDAINPSPTPQISNTESLLSDETQASQVKNVIKFRPLFRLSLARSERMKLGLKQAGDYANQC